MNHVHMFQYNIPADNQFCGYTDRYINIISEWDGKTFYSDNKPMCFSNPINLSFSECISVKDWSIVYHDVSKLTQQHFDDIARQERRRKAIEVLAIEDNPILNRFDDGIKEILADLPY